MAGVKRFLLWALVTLVGFAAIVLSVGFWWVSSLYQSEPADPAQASATFAQVRARFAGVPPAFEVRGDRLLVTKQPPASFSTRTTTRILVWQPRDQLLSQVALPSWISTVATEPVPLEALAGLGDQGLRAVMEAKSRGNELNIRLSDIERYGRTLLLDGVTADGKHVLMWNE
jgi:hypothetical protein